MTLRCAIYTRKSSEEGLEQAFNSLHAQREACQAYVRSQQEEGWSALPDHYDDGAFSGATLARPALQRLLADVAARKIDIVVVYKVDRLSRSLADFARVIEKFETRGVAFVSVTQPFNTTTSMGRLTLNVLLSFAQFERDVTGERIRDKIAASKAKGMWMGGVVPLGYDIPADSSRALVVNEAEAQTVRLLFNNYLQLGRISALKRWAEAEGIRSKARVTSDGRTVASYVFTSGALRHLLANPVYIGEIRHKEQRYAGRHPAILDRKVFNAAQDILAQRSAECREHVSRAKRMLLHGRIFDANGDAMEAAFSSRAGKAYSYYVSAPMPGDAVTVVGDVIRRVAAKAADDFVVRWAARLLDTAEVEVTSAAVTELFHRVEVRTSSVQMVIYPAALPVLAKDAVAHLRMRLEPAECLAAEPANQRLIRIVAPVRLVTRGGRVWIKSPAGQKGVDGVMANKALIAKLRRGHEIVRECRIDRASIKPMFNVRAPRGPNARRLALLSFLAPDLQREIFSGAIRDVEHGVLPLSWARQRELAAGQGAQIGSMVFERNRP
jgi:site-specific DNA recombinase